jgi:hypothetical protein
MIGELLFETENGNRAMVWVYRCGDTFTLKRVDGINTEEHEKGDPYHGYDLGHYVSEAMLIWSDLKADGVEINPKF